MSGGPSQYASAYINQYPENTTYGYDKPTVSGGSVLKTLAITAGVLLAAPLITKSANAILSKAGSRIAGYIGKYATTGMFRGLGEAYMAAGESPTLGAVLRETKTVSGGIERYRSYLSSKNINVNDYKKWQINKHRKMKLGLFFLGIGFMFQIIGNWPWLK